MTSYKETSREDELSLSAGLSWQAAADLCLAETAQEHSNRTQDTSPRTQAPDEVRNDHNDSASTPYLDYSTPNRFTSEHRLLIETLDATYRYVESRIVSDKARHAYQDMAFLCLDECSGANDVLHAKTLLSSALTRLQPIVKSNIHFSPFVDTAKYHRMAIEHALDVATCISRRFVEGGGWVNNVEKDENMFVEQATLRVKQKGKNNGNKGI